MALLGWPLRVSEDHEDFPSAVKLGVVPACWFQEDEMILTAADSVSEIVFCLLAL